MLFFPVQQELDCINDSGDIIGKITFDGVKDGYIFSPTDKSIVLSSLEEASIAVRLAALAAGKSSIPMQDDD